MVTVREHFDVLLVEDNYAQVRLFEEVLKEGKEIVKLHVVCDGEAALEFLKNDSVAIRPDLIFLDLHLPKKRGHEVLRELKSDPRLTHIPVIILTSSNRQEDIYLAYALNANCYIQKPLNFDEFIRMIQGVEKFWFSRPRQIPLN